ncbi:MAG: alanine/glycine:cation symporter family protein [Phycisphaerales bacterium]
MTFVDRMNEVLGAINSVIWHDYVLFFVLGVGILFTLWSGFSQYRALTHGAAVIRGKYDDKNDPGAINHFQALSAALSATVGLGNIAGVSIAIALGGPGAVFWMWVVGFVGMALKTTEVTLSMLHRNTDDSDNPHGGPMFVAYKGFKKKGLGPLGWIIGAIFCVTLLISTVTGGNMFQAWNVGIVTETYFGVPSIVTGIILAILTGVVIIGGIKRIGSVAGRLVPFMCGLYLLAALFVIFSEIDRVPEMFGLIFKSAFGTATAENAFLGGTAGYAFLWGMKRALFSNEAGQGSSPIAHSAAKTDEPAREGIVAGLEPFIDTIVVCTLTTLVVLLTGAYNRGPEAIYETPPRVVAVGEHQAGEANFWSVETTGVPAKKPSARRINGEWAAGDTVFVLIDADEDPNTGRNIRRLSGTINEADDGSLFVEWTPYESVKEPTVVLQNDPEEPDDAGMAGLYNDFVGAALTAHAFDRVQPGLGKWLIVLASWLFALSTLISWSYYGEQGVVYLFGNGAVLPYKLIYCLLAAVATLGFIKTDAELDNLTTLGTGVMLWANIPIMLIFGSLAMGSYRNYIKRLKSGELDVTSHSPAPITDVVEGRDVE